jgi:hypothetical protein
MVITEDEYIDDINGSVSFATQGFYMNPGQALTFPWLSTLAKQFEKYRVLGLQFYYKPLVSGFATNGQSGKVMLSFDYDAGDNLPGSKQQVEDTHPHDDCMPYEEACLTLDPNQLNSQDSKYVRPGMLAAGADIRIYDGGLLAVSTEGNANTDPIGELRVRYSIELSVPVLENASAIPKNFHTAYYTTAITDMVTGVAEAAALTEVENPLGITQAAGVLTLPAGNFVANYTLRFVFTGLSTSVICADSYGVSPQMVYTSGSLTTVTLNKTAFITSSGTSTFSLSCQSAFTTGAVSSTGVLVIQSI